MKIDNSNLLCIALLLKKTRGMQPKDLRADFGTIPMYLNSDKYYSTKLITCYKSIPPFITFVGSELSDGIEYISDGD